MEYGTTEKRDNQGCSESRIVLEDVILQGATQMLQAAIENEVAEYIEQHKHMTDDAGQRLVVRNGHLPERKIITGVGPVKVEQPRVRDAMSEESFTSSILPPYMRRLPSIDALIPALYLRGISTGDFKEALEAILGPNATGLSATNIVRLKDVWKQDYNEWQKRNLTGKHYVYVWADGVHFNVRLEDDRTCILVLLGATRDGRKELLAVHDGYRESKISWLEILRDIKARGLELPPTLAIGDGALGFWAAQEEEWPKTRQQRCWVHKTANILNKMPKSSQPHAKQRIHDMYLAETKEDALKAYDEFLHLYEAKLPKACECLKKDKDMMFTFYDFPAEHWIHIRTTNPIESTFATVRHRTRRTKGCGSRIATLTMVYKLSAEAQKHWRKLNKPNFVEKVAEGIRFVNGIMKEAA